VLGIIGQCETRFYLTGGTALSRGYYQHRYSDDLDFFVNYDADYAEQVELILSVLHKSGFVQDKNSHFRKYDNFTSVAIVNEKFHASLKIDFINDIAAHYGEIISTDLFWRLDSIRNILSNKITALFRMEAKDIADIREIALHNSFNWKELALEASEKEGGLEIPILVQYLQGTPPQKFHDINWIRKPDWERYKKDIGIIAGEILTGSDNSLFLQV
jgi:predicted nucleotidyltransferase component of viral defense system